MQFIKLNFSGREVILNMDHIVMVSPGALWTIIRTTTGDLDYNGTVEDVWNAIELACRNKLRAHLPGSISHD